MQRTSLPMMNILNGENMRTIMWISRILWFDAVGAASFALRKDGAEVFHHLKKC